MLIHLDLCLVGARDTEQGLAGLSLRTYLQEKTSQRWCEVNPPRQEMCSELKDTHTQTHTYTEWFEECKRNFCLFRSLK